MPELPEVEVTRRGVAPHVEGRTVYTVVLRREGLRWPFPADLPQTLAGQLVVRTGRRGKYLLLHFKHGTLIIHLGMSGHLRVLDPGIPPEKHDHFDLEVEGRHVLDQPGPDEVVGLGAGFGDARHDDFNAVEGFQNQRHGRGCARRFFVFGRAESDDWRGRNPFRKSTFRRRRASTF